MITEIIWSVIVAASAYVSRRLLKRLLKKMGKNKKELAAKRVFYIEKVFDVFFVILAAIALALIWSVDIKGISVVASSIFAIAGVAMFAQWSILSNITASIIIFFTFPARIGDRIRIVDGDNSIEGTIREISLFQMELVDSENNTILYPNNLILQKPVIKIK